MADNVDFGVGVNLEGNAEKEIKSLNKAFKNLGAGIRKTLSPIAKTVIPGLTAAIGFSIKILMFLAMHSFATL